MDPAAAVGVGSWGESVMPIRGYPFPEIQDELDRLRARWEQAGCARYEDRMYGDPRTRQQFEAWGHETHDEKTTEMRAMIRELERAQDE